jgi:putative tryptophan/tyrosine transport system substrate-binding protein
MSGMRRREFITLIGGAPAATWPLVARAQQRTLPVIGLLHIGASSAWDFTAFRQGLKEAGYVEGQNLAAIEVRWADNDPDRLPELAADLVHRRVRVIVAFAALATLAAKAATNTIPIVFGYGGDPVQQGLVGSLNRPGGNVTGLTSLSGELVGKKVGMLRELLPQASHFGFLSDPKTPTHELVVKDAQAAASAIGGTIDILTATTTAEIDAVFVRIANERRVQALLVGSDALFFAARVQLAILAARFTVPAIYPGRDFVEAGGLLSYGPDFAIRDREVGRYVGRILKGEDPADLPVQQQSKFELVVNLQTAKAMGLTIPNSLESLADKVIASQ